MNKISTLFGTQSGNFNIFCFICQDKFGFQSSSLLWSINLFHIGAHFASILSVVNKSFLQSSNIFFQYFLSECFSFPQTVIVSYLHCLTVYISARDAAKSLVDPALSVSSLEFHFHENLLALLALYNDKVV